MRGASFCACRCVLALHCDDMTSTLTLRKALSKEENWTKAESLDVVHWFRQILSIVLGIIWGIVPLTGGTGILGFFGANLGLSFFYFNNYLGIEDEDWRYELLQEGMMSSFGLFVIFWVFVYNLLYFN